MTQTKGAPPTSAAKRGNKLFTYEEAVRAGEGKSGSGLGFLGLGGVAIVGKGFFGSYSFKPGQTLFGAVAGIPFQQLVSQVGVQQFLGGSVMVGNVVAGSVGVVTHFLVRSSFTLGLGVAMAAPLIAQATQYGVSWISNLLKPAPIATVTPAAPQMASAKQPVRVPMNGRTFMNALKVA